MRFLIVEDDFVSRQYLFRILQQYGECDLAENGQQGIDAFKAGLTNGMPYDLVCLDIMMPILDGQEALKRMREIEVNANLTQETPIIMTTALDDAQNIAEAYYVGKATAYVPKPIDRDIFIKLLHNLNIIHE